jgi:hypothetical protein
VPKLWKEKNISHAELIEIKKDKILLSKTVNSYWQELLRAIFKNKGKLFPKNF